MLPVLLLPLRVPEPCDLAGQLADWLDDDDDDDNDDEYDTDDEERNPRPNFTAKECYDDLQYIQLLRDQIQRILYKNNYEDALDNIHILQEYNSALQEFCVRGFPVTDLQGEGLTLAWKIVDPRYRSFTPQTESHHSLSWERANVLYNIAVVYTYQAHREEEQHMMMQQSNDNNQQQQQPNRSMWSKITLLLQQAASIVQYLRESIIKPHNYMHSNSIALSQTFLQVWETFLLAEAQRAAYQTFQLQARPKHFMLAKLAAAAAPLYQTVEDLCATADSRFGSIELILDWEDSVRAWGMWMTALTEFHQSIVHKDKKEYGLELARLEGALKFGSFCKEFCDSADTDLLDGLSQQLMPILEQIDERFETAERENDEQHHEEIPEHDELPEVPPQQTVKTDTGTSNIAKLLPALSKPLFVNVMEPSVRRFVDIFHTEMHKVIHQTEQLADEKTEAARTALANVNLPHSLTAYRQEQKGGGIPKEQWERVQEVQNERIDEQLKEDLWKVRNCAEQAKSIYDKIESILDNDLEIDIRFRQQYTNFDGHNVSDIQKSFRQALNNYQRLMKSASESDTLLYKRIEQLDTNPKFRLLKLQKSQLDRLLPASDSTTSGEIDVSLLSNYLVDLSTLFNERDSIIHTLREQAKTYNIADELAQYNTDIEYRQVVDKAKETFQVLINDMEMNLDRQTKLLYKIIQENDRFMRVRDQSNRPTSDSALIKIEDALFDIDIYKKHIIDGQTFYNIIIPKLDKLLNQMNDVSIRLQQERNDYEEYIRQQNNNNNRRPPPDSRSMTRYPSYERQPPTQREQQSRYPPVAAAAAAPPQDNNNNIVDDSMVANLVAMDFDPDKVVAALKKYDNDFERALNDLLSF